MRHPHVLSPFEPEAHESGWVYVVAALALAAGGFVLALLLAESLGRL